MYSSGDTPKPAIKGHFKTGHLVGGQGHLIYTVPGGFPAMKT
jgi:hypothetical protein